MIVSFIVNVMLLSGILICGFILSLGFLWGAHKFLLCLDNSKHPLLLIGSITTGLIVLSAWVITVLEY